MMIGKPNSDNNSAFKRQFSKSRDRVKQVFSGIAGDYDKVNRIISFGQIKRWRSRLIRELRLRDGQRILDVGCGTGTLARIIAREIESGSIVGVDISPEMLDQWPDGLHEPDGLRIKTRIGDATHLDFNKNSFDLVTSAFMLRNVENLPQAISEMRRVVKPEGRVVTLELAKPKAFAFRPVYFTYFNHILPWVGKIVHGRKRPYEHLSASLRVFPNQDELKRMFERVGLRKVKYSEMALGIAAIHSGVKAPIPRTDQGT